MPGQHLKNKTLVDILKQSRDLYGNKVCMKRFSEDRFVDITFDEFADKALNIARGLMSMGLKPGDRVALLSENRPEWGASYLGTLAAEGVNVPLDALLKISGWSHILRDSRSRFIIVSQNYLPEIEQVSDDIPDLQFIICMDNPPPESSAVFLRDLEDKASQYEGTPGKPKTDDLAAIIYTSGTTGQAKGVILTHENIVSDIDGVLQMIDIEEKDNFISVLPIHHTFECTCGFLTPIAGGACITYARGLASKLIVEDIKNNNATIILGVPLLFEKMHDGLVKAISKKPPLTRVVFKTTYGLSNALYGLLKIEAGKKIFKSLREKAGLSSLRLMVAGGAPMPPEVARVFNLLGFTFLQGYGLTESSPVLTFNPIDKRKNESIGLPIPGAELKIKDPDARGIGEILAKGPMVMKGYYNNRTATDEVLKDGWLYTGDSGWVDDEGYYYITGRLKNVIITPAGKNVYPEEIEAELNKSPYVLESLVVGRPTRDQRGEEIQAIIVPEYEYFDLIAEEGGKSFTTEKIEDTIKKEVHDRCSPLADYKRVKYIQVREEEFEKTSTRKIKRFLFTQRPELIDNKRNN
jgi:long-chain acyl-CoA synthetase